MGLHFLINCSNTSVAVMVVGLIFLTNGTATASQRVRIPYVLQDTEWATGIAIVNYESDPVHLYASFIEQDGYYSATTHRVDLGEFSRYEMKIFTLEQLYNYDKEPAVKLPDTTFQLWVQHWADDEAFGVAVFIVSMNAAFPGYGFQQFDSESW